ncbi:MAG: twin-arginine translocase subunit TatC [Gammaproteobacteria bacterium]|nr:twin-arginine translocase subunit TatC [Gammaproteobacteria bacterium]
MLLYLIELRQRLLRCVACFIGLFCVCFYEANELLHVVLSPLMQVLPPSSTFIAIQIAAPLWVSIDVATEVALLLTMPYIFIELWRFFVPALYRQERLFWRSFMGLSLGLFALGAAGCFFMVLPLMCRFLVAYLPLDVRVMPDVVEAVHFILNMVWVFGVGFQFPLICMGLVKLGWVSVSQLVQARRYVIVGAFIAGMMLAPPDVLSQTLLALPFWGVYEVGVVLARITAPRRAIVFS